MAAKMKVGWGLSMPSARPGQTASLSVPTENGDTHTNGVIFYSAFVDDVRVSIVEQA